MTGSHVTTPAEGNAWRAARCLRSGALAGVASAIAFAVVRAVLISDIWFSLVPMALAGAGCGASIASSYRHLQPRRTVRGWLAFNGLFVAMFVALAVVSVLVFDPVTTITAVVAAQAPPGDLISQALPMTGLFVVVACALLYARYGRRLTDLVTIVTTVALLVLVLGLNVSIIGLVEVTASTAPLIAEQFGLIAVLGAIYAVVFLVLERRHLRRRVEDPSRAVAA